MNKHRTYRTSAFVLAIVFCLFNVGLPIIISACPMMNAGVSRASCCVGNENFMPGTVSVARNSSCCRTVLAANRNTIEFLQSNDQIHHLLKIEPLSFVVSIDQYDGAGIQLQTLYSKMRSAGEFLHPLDDDIPVLVSSLLI